MAKSDLKTAYDIDGPDDAKRLYREWASSYDETLSVDLGYIAPRLIGAIFKELSSDDAPVLDVGAGTGLLAEALGQVVVDGIDISREMLDEAGRKGLYRKRIVSDVLRQLPMDNDVYGGVVSSGTLTHGHVGPACLTELLRVSRPGALFVCGCVPAVFDGAGFGSALARLNASGQIGPLQFRDIPLYDGADHANAADRGLVFIFRKSIQPEQV